MDGLILNHRRPTSPSSSNKHPDPPLLSVSSSVLTSRHRSPLAVAVAAEADGATTTTTSSVSPGSSSSEILECLRSTTPSQATIVQCLHLLNGNSTSDPFDVRAPSPIASQIVKVLLEVTLPDLWHVLDGRERGVFARCLVSPTGLGGIVASLKKLIAPSRRGDGGVGGVSRQNLGNLLVLLQMVLARRGFLYQVWILAGKEPEMKRDILWKEFTALVGGGKLLSIAAEAESVLGRLSSTSTTTTDTGQKERWVGVGKLYALWIGREIAEACLRINLTEPEPGSWKALCLILVASFRLGYTDSVVEGLTFKLVGDLGDESARLQRLVSLLPAHDKRSYLLSLLRVISAHHLQTTYPDDDDAWWRHDTARVSGAAALLEKFILRDDDDFKPLVLEWFTSSAGGGVGEPIALRRSIVAVVAKDELAFRELFEKLLQQFADKLWIKHTPIVRQEANVQILLLCAGHAHRHSPSFLARLVRSSNFLNGVSNRLAASSHRARFLGMVVGEAFSGLIHADPKMKMSFDTEDMESVEGKWWKSIPAVDDKIGDIKDLFPTGGTVARRQKPKPKKQPPPPTSSTAIQIISEEAQEDTEESEDEFTPYALPDSDPEDSDSDDATTIDRNKPSAPVYIRQLLSYLQSSEDATKQTLALAHASTLIRRKSHTSPKELSSHLPELLSALSNLSDRFELPDFSPQRDAALTALVVSNPKIAGPWLAHAFFNGDYSLSQRGTLLSAIGSAARELAGLSTPPPLIPSSLPPNLAAVWSGSARGGDGGVTALASQLRKTLLTPLAAAAADTVTGPRVLKVRTFSSRLAVEARRGPPVARKILEVVAESFFFPLSGGWYVASRQNHNHHESSLLSLLLHTLSVLLHAAGPAAPALPQISGEFWGLLISLRGEGSGDVKVCEAVLLGVLTLLEVNLEAEGGGKRVAEEFGAAVVEMRGFAEGVLDGPWGGEEGVRALAAGVLVKVAEVEEGWRRALLGGLGVVE